MKQCYRKIRNELCYLATILCLLFLSGCGKSEEAEIKFNQIEELLLLQPDSALVLLNSVQSQEPFLFFYHLGRIYYNQTDYPNAIIAFTKAEELVKNTDDNLTIGKLYSHIGFINRVVNNFSKSLVAYHKAYEYYSRTDSTSYKIAVGINIGQVYCEMRQYELAEKYLMDGIEQAYKIGNYTLLNSAVELFRQLCWLTENVESLKMIMSSEYKAVSKESIYNDDTILYSDVLTQKMLNAKEHKNRWSAIAINKDSSLVAFRDYHIHTSYNDYLAKVGIYDTTGNRVLDTTMRSSLQQPIVNAQNEYFKEQNEIKALKLKYNKQLLIASTAILLLIIALILLVSRQIITSKNQEINKYIDIAQTLESSLFEQKRDMQSVVTDMNKEINGLFVKQFDLLDKLCSTYYDTIDIKKEKEHLFMLIKSEIGKLQKDKRSIMQLEEIVNKYKNNIMTITRESLPELSEHDLQLLCFMYAGFSAKAISVFTADSVTSIYNKKSRLKARLAQSDLKNKDILLANLS